MTLRLSLKKKHSTFLKSLYESGGKENKKFILESTLQAPLAYASRNEFVRIIEYLQKPNWIGLDFYCGPGASPLCPVLN